MIVDDFREILEKYGTVSDNEPYSENDFARKIRQEFKDSVKVFVENNVEDRSLYHVKGSAGRYGWATNANIRIGNYNSCRTFQIGLYLFYFFNREGDGVYLSLDQGQNNPKDGSIRIQIANRLIDECDFEIPDGFTTDFLKEKLNPDAIMSKFYPYESLSEEVLENDLRAMLRIYEEIIPKYLETLKEMDLTDVLDDINKSGKNEVMEFMSSAEIGEGVDKIPFSSDLKRNLIYFGAPGTGKSYNLNVDKDELDALSYERVTFHPDYSYANFVGTYKPVPKDDSISYEYVPGPFMRVLVNALNNPDKPFLLIVEEINRANTAAVFGDVFQLLDRNDEKESTYPIDVPQDVRDYLEKKLDGEVDRIKIPQNMFIWATMNSADQGVFPMDTAFKRRWDFKYLGIDDGADKIEKTFVMFNNQKVSWDKLRRAINRELSEEYKINEDKLLGPFFAFNQYLNKEIPVDVFKETFQNKIIMYLFEDAARSKRNDLFKGALGDLTNITYSKICEEFIRDGMGIKIFCDNIQNANLLME